MRLLTLRPLAAVGLLARVLPAAAAAALVCVLVSDQAFAQELTGLPRIVNDIGLPLIAVAVPVLIALFKKALPSVPAFLLPLLAPVIGGAGDILLSLLASVPATGWKGALAGLAGVGVREVVDQAKKALPS